MTDKLEQSLEGVERSSKNPIVIYIVKKIFPEKDDSENHGRLYQVLLPGDVGYQAIDERLKNLEADAQ